MSKSMHGTLSWVLELTPVAVIAIALGCMMASHALQPRGNWEVVEVVPGGMRWHYSADRPVFADDGTVSFVDISGRRVVLGAHSVLLCPKEAWE
jgi:hypothetical protein